MQEPGYEDDDSVWNGLLGKVLTTLVIAVLTVFTGALFFHTGAEATAELSCGSDGCTRAGYAGIVYVLFGGIPVFLATVVIGWRLPIGLVSAAVVLLSFVAGLILGALS